MSFFSWLFGNRTRKELGQDEYVWGDDPIDGFLSTATLLMDVHGTEYTVALLRTNEPGREPVVGQNKVIPGGMIVNTVDKRMWLVDKDGIPVEVELTYKNHFEKDVLDKVNLDSIIDNTK